MEALIPKLFIITAEASLVLFLILLVIILFNSKAKRRDIKAANQLISHYVDAKEERLAAIKAQLKSMAFSGNMDEQAEQLYNQEKSLLKDFLNIYLRRDTYRLLDYPDSLKEVDDHFLKINGSSTTPASSEITATNDTELSSEENANATIMAREQAESNEAHIKELSELRLKNTELNEHLFEALETITALMTEHGKKTGQEVETNAQKILEAIIYLRDNRLGEHQDPSQLAPSPDDGHDQVDDPWAVDLASGDGTLDDSTAVNLGISEELNTDLDSLTEEQDLNEQPAELEADSITDTASSDNNEDDPWADALSEQAATEANDADSTEPAATAEEDDPWADALAEQAATEAEVENDTAAEEDDPWADALAEQAATEASEETPEEEDPWAAALAEQEKSEKK